MVAAAIIGAGVIGAGASMYGSSQASKGAKDAAQLQQNQYFKTREDLLPYNAAGQDALHKAQLLTDLGQTGGGQDYVSQASGLSPGPLAQANLEQTPGYQFTLNQGLKAVQSQAAARGLGMSGASLKGAANYATGLASNTYQQQFQNILNLNTAQQQNLQNQYGRLSGLASLGENAAAQTGIAGTSAASTAGNYLNQAGLAQAAGTQGVGNAVTGGVNNYLAYNALQQYLNPQGGTGGYTPVSTTLGNQPMTP